MTQNLSAAAKRSKAARELAYANTPERKAKRAENQRMRRAAKKAGRNIDGLDYDHKTGEFKSVRRNRGNDGEGTKEEGSKTYRITKKR